MISIESYSELLGVLYSAPLRTERWGRFLDLLCEHTRSRGGFLICADSRLGTSIVSQGGNMALSATAVDAYDNVYAPQDPYRLPMLLSGKTGLLDCESLVPTSELLRSEMYRDIIAPAGLRFPTLILLTCTVRRLEGISFWRTEAEGLMDADSVRLLELLVPHIQSAMEIRQALGTAYVKAEGAEAMADASRTPTFLLADDGEVLHTNAAARELVRDGDGLAVRHGALVAAKGSMRRPLRALLAGVSAGTSTFAGFAAAKPLSLERPSGRRPLQLLASPAPGSGTRGVLLLATDPEKPVVLRDDVLREHYGLTPAETEVANGLLTGYALKEIAALRRVSVGTVRDQVKAILAKTGTNKQAELMTLLMKLPQMRHPA